MCVVVFQTLAGLPDQDSYYDMVDCLEEQGIETMAQRHLSRKGTDLDLVEQFNIYEVRKSTHYITAKLNLNVNVRLIIERSPYYFWRAARNACTKRCFKLRLMKFMK